MKTCLITCIIAILLFGCKKEEDFVKTLPSCSPGVLFTHSPVPLDDVIRFVPLGHYKPSSHTQGLWFLPGKDVYPEDPHLALILNYYYPQKNVFSVGTSVPGLPILAYEFYPEESGTHNRSFDKITADGNIYSFSDFYNIWDEPITDYTFPTENVILIQLTDLETLRIEKQTKNDGPPWSFKNNYVDFKR